MSPLIGKKVKPSNNSAICDQLHHNNFLPSFDNFSVLAHEDKKVFFGKPANHERQTITKRNISLATLHLFDEVA